MKEVSGPHIWAEKNHDELYAIEIRVKGYIMLVGSVLIWCISLSLKGPTFCQSFSSHWNRFTCFDVQKWQFSLLCCSTSIHPLSKESLQAPLLKKKPMCSDWSALTGLSWHYPLSFFGISSVSLCNNWLKVVIVQFITTLGKSWWLILPRTVWLHAFPVFI